MITYPCWDLSQSMLVKWVSDYCCWQVNSLVKYWLKQQQHVHMLIGSCDIDGFVQDCNNSIADALELLQSCTKPPILFLSITYSWQHPDVKFHLSSLRRPYFVFPERAVGKQNVWRALNRGHTMHIVVASAAFFLGFVYSGCQFVILGRRAFMAINCISWRKYDY